MDALDRLLKRMRIMQKILIVCLAALLPCLAYGAKTQKDLPANIALTDPDPKNQYVKSITFEFPGVEYNDDAFVAMEACILENAKSGVQRQNQGNQVGAGETIKAANEERGYIIAQGVTSMPEGMIYRMYTFQVRLVEGPTRKMKFTNINQTVGNYMETEIDNTLAPVGAWKGAKPTKAYAAMEEVANTINECINDW